MMNLKHIHTYVLYKDRSKKAKVASDKYFRCADPECSHFAKYEMVKGKRSKCNGCGVEFILDAEAMRRVEPKCLSCSNTTKGKIAKAAAGLLDKLMKDDKQESEGMEDLFR